jgi:serine/threonine-protein kinase
MALLASERPTDEDEPTRLARERVGQRLRDRWRLDELLGVGGMAAVYSATHRNGKRVAVKVLHARLANNEEAKHRFVEEAYLANRVGHPGVVSILDDDVAEDGAAFLVMDLLEGETLDARIERYRQLDALDVLELTDRLLDVLVAAHAASIIHRDIKPNNIFITGEGRIRLLDFGIARLNEPNRRRTTQHGLAVGTPAFMPPEQARGHLDRIDGRTDLWAVGATMFMALTGRQVHEAETLNEELLAAMTRKAPSLASVEATFPPALCELVDRALAFERDERWEDAATMQQAVREIAANLRAELPGTGSRESFVAFEDFTPPVASGFVLGPPRYSASSHRSAARTSSLPAPSRRASGKVAVLLAIAGAMGLLAWQQVRRDHAAKAIAHSEAPAIAVAPPARLPAAVGPSAVVEIQQQSPASGSTPPTEASARPSRTVPARGKSPARRPQFAPAQPASDTASEAKSPATVAPPQPPPQPIDPLDRRR